MLQRTFAAAGQQFSVLKGAETIHTCTNIHAHPVMFPEALRSFTAKTSFPPITKGLLLKRLLKVFQWEQIYPRSSIPYHEARWTYIRALWSLLAGGWRQEDLRCTQAMEDLSEGLMCTGVSMCTLIHNSCGTFARRNTNEVTCDFRMCICRVRIKHVFWRNTNISITIECRRMRHFFPEDLGATNTQ